MFGSKEKNIGIKDTEKHKYFNTINPNHWYSSIQNMSNPNFFWSVSIKNQFSKNDRTYFKDLKRVEKNVKYSKPTISQLINKMI